MACNGWQTIPVKMSNRNQMRVAYIVNYINHQESLKAEAKKRAKENGRSRY